MSNFKQVTKEEFDKFVSEYPNKLDWDVTGICEPPLGSHNDFTEGKVWPESMVTKVRLFDGSDYHMNRQAEYFVKEL